MKLHTIALLTALTIAPLATLPPLAHAAMPPGVAWVSAAQDADVDKAFARAKAENKPVLLYWGAQWCPPCNQLKATLFNRADFIERARAVVPVFVDGDLPGAQKLGTRFKVRGYPTMIVFTPEGGEITRLPGEADAPQVMQVLQLALSRGRPVAQVLMDAKGGKPLSGNEWKMLAFYSWDTDQGQLVPEAEVGGLLGQLAVKCPASEPAAAQRLWLKALANSDDGKGVKSDDALREKVRAWLGDAAVARAHADVLTNSAREITRALESEPGPERTAVLASFEGALKRLQADASLSRADRLQALLARVELARIDAPRAERHPKLPAALAAEVKATSAQMDHDITDGFERQAVITLAGHLLGQAGLWKESDDLLKANLTKSHSPYYLMSQLGGNARKLGRVNDALQWFEQAYTKSEGPATRLQWGSSYLSALVELAPKDHARIERAAQGVLQDAAAQPHAFYERSERSLKRVGTQLKNWNKGPQEAAVLKRLQQQLDGVCGKLAPQDAQRPACEALLKPAA
jgi:thioredoxin-like negative regulator of GroEL